MLTRVFALELRERDITVNAVSLEVGKPCAPDLVADVIAYLLSDQGHASPDRCSGSAIRDCGRSFPRAGPHAWVRARS